MLLYPKINEIKRRREALNFSMNGLSVEAKLSPPSIYRIESGITEKVSSFRAEAIAKILRCNITDIFEEVKK